MIMMAGCKEKTEAARRRLLALDNFFKWLLSKGDHQATRARADFGLNVKSMRNPCKGIEKVTLEDKAPSILTVSQAEAL